MARVRTEGGGEVEIRIRDLIGKEVRTVRDMRNGWGVIPAGTSCVVDGWWRSGVSLRSRACSQCGLSASISRVELRDFVLLSEEGD